MNVLELKHGGLLFLFFVYEPALHQVDTKNRRLEALRFREYSNISSLMFGRDPCY